MTPDRLTDSTGPTSTVAPGYHHQTKRIALNAKGESQPARGAQRVARQAMAGGLL